MNDQGSLISGVQSPFPHQLDVWTPRYQVAQTPDMPAAGRNLPIFHLRLERSDQALGRSLVEAAGSVSATVSLLSAAASLYN